jgi:ADP-ribosyl-[dinitrogen reductase] hydrolase
MAPNTLDRLDRSIGALLGLAVGDAIGTTLEFVPRDQIITPLTDMVGGGPFNLQPGQWTDDTSMALCLATSLIDHGFDMHDQLNRYLDWYENGYMSSTGRCFDIGHTTQDALTRYRETGDTRAGSTSTSAAGNGSIMRLAPVVVYFLDSPADAIRFASEQSKTTHRAPECLMSCQLMAEVLHRALRGDSKEEVQAPSSLDLPLTDRLKAIALRTYRGKRRDDIRSSGYVVDSLEAALWCFSTTTNYSDCVLLAANLGDDADTTAAVCGQIAGAFYGAIGIPKGWQERVFMQNEIKAMAQRLASSNMLRN